MTRDLRKIAKDVEEITANAPYGFLAPVRSEYSVLLKGSAIKTAFFAHDKNDDGSWSTPENDGYLTASRP